MEESEERENENRKFEEVSLNRREMKVSSMAEEGASEKGSHMDGFSRERNLAILSALYYLYGDDEDLADSVDWLKVSELIQHQKVPHYGGKKFTAEFCKYLYRNLFGDGCREGYDLFFGGSLMTFPFPNNGLSEAEKRSWVIALASFDMDEFSSIRGKSVSEIRDERLEGLGSKVQEKGPQNEGVLSYENIPEDTMRLVEFCKLAVEHATHTFPNLARLVGMSRKEESGFDVKNEDSDEDVDDQLIRVLPYLHSITSEQDVIDNIDSENVTVVVEAAKENGNESKDTLLKENKKAALGLLDKIMAHDTTGFLQKYDEDAEHVVKRQIRLSDIKRNIEEKSEGTPTRFLLFSVRKDLLCFATNLLFAHPKLLEVKQAVAAFCKIVNASMEEELAVMTENSKKEETRVTT